MGGAILLLIIGAAAGFIATRIMRMETDIVTTIVIGMAGALIGGLVLRALITVMGMLAGLVGAILGSVALIWLWKTYGKRR
ncbi:GlsB/YeaQ/YmgE family stress response membrane protein [Litorivita pollutaquae]|uniref:GlsB/YeaQ/YmgE family stress response membrane protein n=1 Tax=Litorivita pollutaquae TaxID=2200892 RepID=A0A2V4MQJ0_9RHOB|nr:GlsB/YeaQ/YmgE family stress response membrane protein [Litorivita pollutaquae]PYC49021.1 GlsB/YeaQ/YmgE family stress response membrane protein [Litorivita pollutaquae]